ncbi:MULTISPECIES: GGDEF domain-containing protein [Shewanella]|uniref:diguanylate cyclase n=1 Tax=Shewanella chilikensis TaxID=558541 RepID=A0A6G7LWQ6_9GAMM|nr:MULTISPECIES: sensor domain-containing diguanylate cyclase [Shewanella]QIJ06243.1 diguanylate cyclase [Shewanella chilikensis]HCD13529.1 GGDEF domain-containing protein [Shewanella sp.]
MKQSSVISHKMTLVIIGVSSFFALMTMAAQLFWNYQDGVEGSNRRLHEYVEANLPGMAQAIWDVDHKLLRDILIGIGMQPYVSGASLSSADGIALQVGKNQALDNEIFLFPIIYRQQQIGELKVQRSRNQLYYELWRQMILIVVGNGLKTLLMIYVILTLVRSLVTGRLAALAAYVNRIDLGQPRKVPLPNEVGAANQDEIGSVARAIEQMYRRIRTDFARKRWQQRHLTRGQRQLSEQVEFSHKELAWQARANELLADLSLQFLKVQPGDVDQALADVGRQIAELFAVERVTLLEIKEQQLCYRSVWSRRDDLLSSSYIDISELNRFSEQLNTRHMIVVEDVETLQSDDSAEYRLLKQLQLRSLALFAITDGQDLLGILSLSNSQSPKLWPQSRRAMLTQFAAALNELLVRERRDLQMLGLQRELLGLNHKLKQLSETDELTGLANRRPFTESLARLLASKEEGALIMLDVDHFKAFNDCFGHPAGDRVLQRLAQAMRKALPERALLARVGGEEFALVLPGVDRRQAEGVAETLLTQVRELQITHGSAPAGIVTISLGLALLTQNTRDLSEVIRVADKALYQAKHQGRNTWCIA